jgi:hypothetical protein
LLALFVAACQTPPAPVERETFDDQVNVPDVGVSVVEPDAGPKPEPEPAVVEPAQKATENFIAKPGLPEEMSFQETALARTVEQQRRGLVFAPIVAGDCSVPTAIRATADEGAGYTIDSCKRAVDAAHALTFERRESKLGVIDISDVAIRHNGVDVWSVFGDCVAMRQQETACKSDYVARRLTVFSFVGPVLSYSTRTSQASAGAPPHHGESAHVVDVRTGRTAKFDALIDKSSILNALKRDSYMRRMLSPVELDASKTLDDVWELWGTTTFSEFGSYYFAEWDGETGQVALRIQYREDDAADTLKELGIWVMPKRTWRAAFEEAASSASGFFPK